MQKDSYHRLKNRTIYRKSNGNQRSYYVVTHISPYFPVAIVELQVLQQLSLWISACVQKPYVEAKHKRLKASMTFRSLFKGVY